MKLAELRLEMDDKNSNFQRGGRLEKWKQLTLDAALKHNAQIELPDAIENLVSKDCSFVMFCLNCIFD